MVYTLWGEPDSGSFMIEAALAEAGQPVNLIDHAGSGMSMVGMTAANQKISRAQEPWTAP